MGGIAEPLERVLILHPGRAMERQPANHDVERVGRTRDVLGVTSDEVDVLCLPFRCVFRAISSGALVRSTPTTDLQRSAKPNAT